ncbi:metallophosphoesterase [soil metagenome]
MDMLLRSLFLIALIVAIDLYVFQAFRFVFRDSSVGIQKATFIIFWALTAFSVSVIVAALLTDFQNWPKAFRTYATAFIFILTISKLFIVIFLLTDDILRGVRWVFGKVFTTSSVASNANTDAPAVKGGISRSDFLVKTGILVASLPFISLIWGMAKGAYDYQVKKIKIKLPNLPSEFEGYRILQISDLHTGSFVSTEPLTEAVKIINAQNADLILFTGDLVNNKHEEVIQHMPVLSQIKSKHGVYSILGNHDYGDYVQWDSKEEKEKNLADLIQSHKDMGWDILLDEHRIIEKNGQSIGLIGVQNWSMHLRFPKYGSMEKATKGIAYQPVNILMSHDPSHWRGEIIDKYPQVDLMLAGHTHGFQFGIDLPNFKWSPVQYIYKEWAGIYNQGKQHLYVNRGLGFLGYPGRVGVLPEITILELSRA